MEATAAINEMINGMDTDMNGHIDRLKKDLGALRTGRASAQLIEGVKVDYYGSVMPIKQVAAINVRDAHTIEVQPWDMGAIDAILKALQKADLGCSPMSDGKLIRLSIPPMTEDRRKALVKTVKGMAEDFKVKIRNERRDAIEKIKKSLKAKEISEDDCKRSEQTVQKMTDAFIVKIDGVIAEKEKELMTV